jgi:V8-like Glu-specific endopeptidase
MARLSIAGRGYAVNVRPAIMSAAVIAAVVAGAVPGTAALASGRSAAPGSGCVKVRTLTFSDSEQSAARRYWTPARMRTAKGFTRAAVGRLDRMGKSGLKLAEAGRPAAGSECAPTGGLDTTVAATAPRKAPGNAPSSKQSAGYPAIGKLTFDVDGVLGLNCTASVIRGTPAPNKEELILTAAHCVDGTIGGVPYFSTNFAFAPMWHDNQAPYGTWTARKVFLDSGWLKCPIPVVNCNTNPAYDYAIIVLAPQNGKGVGDVTGANGWSVSQPAALRDVTIAGIPSSSSSTLVTVADTVTVTESGERYREAATPGFTDGSSGGPWLRDFSTASGRGVLIGDTGGFEQGGPASGSPSYSDYWTSDFAALVKEAVAYEG